MCDCVSISGVHWLADAPGQPPDVMYARGKLLFGYPTIHSYLLILIFLLDATF